MKPDFDFSSNIEIETKDLPADWKICQLKDCIELVNGRAYKQSEMLDAGTPLIRIQNLSGGNSWYYSDLKLPEKQYCDNGDLLFAWSATFGPYIWNGSKSIYHYHIWKMILKPTIDKKFAFYLLKDLTDKIKAKSHGGTIVHITKVEMEKFPLALPSLAEQQRIVARVEALLSHVNAARNRLNRVPLIMKMFRQVVLAAACSGRLTEGGREEHPETKSAFEELTELCRARKTGSKKYLKHFEKASISLPIIDYDTDNIEIPDTWYLTNVDFLAFVTKLAGFEYTKYFNLKDSGEIPVIRAQNIQMGKFVNTNIKYISKDISNILERSQINGGEILIVYVGTVGNVCLAPSNGRWHLSSNVGKIELDWMLNKYLLLYLQSPFGLKKILAGSKATTQPSLSMGSIRETVVYVPPLAEQYEIVRRVDLLFERADAIEREVVAANRRCERLTQAVLAKAFRGEL